MKPIAASRAGGLLGCLLLLLPGAGPAFAAEPSTNCSAFKLDAKDSQPVPGDSGSHKAPDSLHSKECAVRSSHGFPLPDPQCTPGKINSTVKEAVLRNPNFTTKCLRDDATSADQKEQTYIYYNVPKPQHNTGVMQTCELDHLVSLELGGADTLDNIWPQCGPDKVVLRERYFKQKDAVENYLAKQVREGTMSLDDAQKGISSDWTQYLDQARKACSGGKCE
jgi:hypothetical protein